MDYGLPGRPRTRQQKEQFLKAYFEQKKKNTKENNAVGGKEGEVLVIIDDDKESLNFGFNRSPESRSLSVDFNGEGVGSVGSVKGGNLGWKMGKRSSRTIGFSGTSNCASSKDFGVGKKLGLQKGGECAVDSLKLENSAGFDDGDGHFEGKKGKRSDVVRTHCGGEGKYDEGDGDDANDNDDEVLMVGEGWCPFEVGDDRQCQITNLFSSSELEAGSEEDRILSESREDGAADLTNRFRGKTVGKGSIRGSSSNGNEAREIEVFDERDRGEKAMAGGALGEGLREKNRGAIRTGIRDCWDEVDEEIQIIEEKIKGKVDGSMSRGDDKNADLVDSSGLESSTEDDCDSDYTFCPEESISDSEEEQSDLVDSSGLESSTEGDYDESDYIVCPDESLSDNEEEENTNAGGDDKYGNDHDDIDHDDGDHDSDDDGLAMLVDDDDDHESGKEKGSPCYLLGKKFYELEALVRDVKDTGTEYSSGGMAWRARSQSLVAARLPFCIEEELIMSSPEHLNDKDEEKNHNSVGRLSSNTCDSQWINRSSNGATKRGPRKARELAVPLKRRHIHEQKDHNAHGSFVDSILEDQSFNELEHFGDAPAEEEREPSLEETPLQLKFTFGVEQPEKPELDEEQDKLWRELELAIASTKIGSADFSVVSRSNYVVNKRSMEKRKGVEKLLQRRPVPQWTGGQQGLEASDHFVDKTTQGDGAPSMAENPLDFRSTFGFEQTERLPVDSESDKELDELWKELDLGLASSEIRSPDSSMVDNRELECGISQETLCREGKHDLILDEEVGMKCTFCSHVNLEIRHILSPFYEHPFGISERRDHGRVDHHVLHNPVLHDIGCISLDSSHAPATHPNATVWDIIPGIKQGMYPHQQEGFEFLWKNIAGSTKLVELRRCAELDNGGCIISHAPGTGKTRLTIAFLLTYMKEYEKCRPVIIAPANILPTWEEEFCKWNVNIPFHNLNNLELTGKEDASFLGMCQDRIKIRLAKLYSWARNHSILGMSYRLFEQLAGDKIMIDCENGKKGQQQPEILSNSESENIRRVLRELPGLLVLDEGHIPRNEDSLVFKALLRIETEKCIILSGTPFQNNLSELYNTLCLVRPRFLETIVSVKNSRHLPIEHARKVTRGKRRAFLSTLNTDEDLQQLRARIRPFVHVHNGNILQKTLPGLRDFVVVLRPTSWQRKLLQYCIDSYKRGLTFDYQTSLISLHPYLSCKCLPKEGVALFGLSALKKLKGDMNAGVKTRFVVELIRLSIALDEKVLIFSQFIEPLKFISELLESHLGWREGQEMLFMSGEINEHERQSIMSSFNGALSSGRVLLASTKACSEGISLIGASRVVLLDTVWNPSVERQAIGRAYRIGQKKVVHVYHLITSGTLEGEKHGRQIEKDRVSKLVFCCTNKENEELKISAQVSEDRMLEQMVHSGRLTSMFEKIYPPGVDSNFIDNYSWVNTLDS